MATFGPSHRPRVLAKSSPFWPRSCQVGDRVFLWDGSTYILWLHRGTGTNRAPASLVAFLNQPKYIEKCATLVELKMFLTAEAFRIRSVTASWLWDASRNLTFYLTPIINGSAAQAQKRLHPRATAKSRRWSKWTRKNCWYLLALYPP